MGKTAEGQDGGNPTNTYAGTLTGVAKPDPNAAVTKNLDFAAQGETHSIFDDPDARKAPPNTPLDVAIIGG